ncbi:MAG: hypothetical protein FJX71_07055 [Alphaproteobacteria bacterium]|nr:hypothetical protein [Alphaproteobacteria bacterium]
MWLTGFTEAEGCFSTTESIGMRYGIGQKTDRYILEAIREKFKMGAQVRERKTEPGFYVIETGGKEALGRVIEHYTRYPLMGEKRESFNKLKEKYKEKNKL